MRWFVKSGLYGLWSVGAYILFRVFNGLASWLDKYQSQTYHMEVQWVLLMDLVFGIYIGLLFVRRWKIKLNIPLLIFVLVPSIMVNPIFDIWILHYPLIVEASLGFSIHDVLGVLSGLVLMIGLFDAGRNIQTLQDRA